MNIFISHTSEGTNALLRRSHHPEKAGLWSPPGITNIAFTIPSVYGGADEKWQPRIEI